MPVANDDYIFGDSSPEDTKALRPLNMLEKRVIFLTICGSFVGCFDFTIYVFFKDVLSMAFFSEQMPEWLKTIVFVAVIAAGYVCRPLGGIVMANYGDRYGRKPILVLSLLILSFCTLAIALLPTYVQVGVFAPLLLLLFRLVHGLAFGGEVPATWVYLAENVPRSHIGMACGLLTAGFILSVFFSNLLWNFLSSTLTQADMLQYGWRIPFVIGGLLTFATILLRAKLPETKVWLFAQRQNRLTTNFPLKTALKHYRFGILTTLVLSWFTASLFMVVLLIIPNLSLLYLDVDSRVMNLANLLGTLFGAIGTVVFGYLADRFNLGKVLIVGCVALAMSSVFCYSHLQASTLQDSNELIFLAYMLLGFFFGVIGIIPSICVRLFPVEVRFSGVSFGYNVAYAVTGLVTPFLLGYATSLISLAPALYIVFICVIGIMVGLFLTNLQGLHRIENVGQ